MKTILIVEDEKDIAEMLSVFLENEGYRTVTAGDGLEGLGLFLSDPHRYDCEDAIIYTHIKNIRKKLGEDVIRNIRGVGYKKGSLQACCIR